MLRLKFKQPIQKQREFFNLKCGYSVEINLKLADCLAFQIENAKFENASYFCKQAGFMCIVLHQQFAFTTCPLYACWGIMFCLRPPLYSNQTRTLYSNPTRTLYVEFFFRDTINYITKFNSLPHIFVLCLITLRTITTSLTPALTQTPLFALHDIQI